MVTNSPKIVEVSFLAWISISCYPINFYPRIQLKLTNYFDKKEGWTIEKCTCMYILANFVNCSLNMYTSWSVNMCCW